MLAGFFLISPPSITNTQQDAASSPNIQPDKTVLSCMSCSHPTIRGGPIGSRPYLCLLQHKTKSIILASHHFQTNGSIINSFELQIIFFRKGRQYLINKLITMVFLKQPLVTFFSSSSIFHHELSSLKQVKLKIFVLCLLTLGCKYFFNIWCKHTSWKYTVYYYKTYTSSSV